MENIPTKAYDFQQGKVLLFDKKINWTSFDLVRKVRNLLCHTLSIKKLKVGHAGTLDPRATGLMIVCTGKFTKKIESFQSGEKEYIATIKLGATTPSFDMETEEDATYPTSQINRENTEELLKEFTGEILQVPPLFSAIHVNGKRAYNLARKGENIEMNARPVFIKEIELQKFSSSEIVLRVVCGKGTYIRSLARDIGRALNSGAYLTALRRIRIGDFKVEEAMTIEEFKEKTNYFVTN